jgi:hypothetical protein
MFNKDRLGTLLLLFTLIDVISFSIFGIATFAKDKVFPYQIYLNVGTILFFFIGLKLSMPIIKEKGVSIISHLIITHHESLIILGIISILFALFPQFQLLLMIKALVYFALWFSFRK